MGIIYNEMIKESRKRFLHLEFDNSTSVNYWPYIGNGYFSSSVKILILGESHYCPDPSNKKEERTNELIISDYLDQNYSRNFCSFMDYPKWIPLPKNSYLKGFRNTARMLAQNFEKQDQCCDYVWENLAFFNFFQKPVAPNPKNHNHEWLYADYDNYIEQARNAFSEVMGKLIPDVVIVWGNSKLYKEWLPLNKEKLYSEVKFFPIKHPSRFKREDYKVYFDKWNDFVRVHNITEDYSMHHPYYKKIEKIFSDVCKYKDIAKLFNKWYGERSIGFELYQDKGYDKNGFIRQSPLTGKSNAIIFLFTMTEYGESVFTLSTRLESEIETQKIVNHTSFDFFNQKLNTKSDGIFELCRMEANVTYEEILSKIMTVLYALRDYRNSLFFTD